MQSRSYAALRVGKALQRDGSARPSYGIATSGRGEVCQTRRWHCPAQRWQGRALQGHSVVPHSDGVASQRKRRRGGVQHRTPTAERSGTWRRHSRAPPSSGRAGRCIGTAKPSTAKATAMLSNATAMQGTTMATTHIHIHMKGNKLDRPNSRGIIDPVPNSSSHTGTALVGIRGLGVARLKGWVNAQGTESVQPAA